MERKYEICQEHHVWPRRWHTHKKVSSISDFVKQLNSVWVGHKQQTNHVHILNNSISLLTICKITKMTTFNIEKRRLYWNSMLAKV